MKTIIYFLENDGKNTAKTIKVPASRKSDMIDLLLAEGCVITKVENEEGNNFCSAVVVWRDAVDNEKRTSVCSIEEAMRYVQEVVLANNYKFIAIERGFNY